MNNTTSTIKYHDETKDILITFCVLVALFILYIFCKDSKKDELDMKNRASRAQARIDARSAV